MSGPYKVTEVQAHTVFIDEEGTVNRVVIDRLTPVKKSTKHAKQATNTDNESVAQTKSTPKHTVKDANNGDKDKEVEKDVISQILHHVQRPEGMHYVVLWYGYGTQDDSVEPAAHIPQRLIDR